MAANDQEEARSSDTGVGACLARHGGLSYLEIPAVDARQSATFYEKVLGWNLRGHDTDDPRFTRQSSARQTLPLFSVSR